MSKQKRPANLDGGIKDWPQKCDALRTIFGAWSRHEMFKKMLIGFHTDAKQISGTASDMDKAARKWENSTPYQFTDEIEHLVKRVGCTSKTGEWFIKATIDEFIHELPKATRDKLELGGRPALATHPVIYLHHTDEKHSMAAGVKNGILDTRHYFSTADGAEAWERLVTASQYRSYNECKEGLHALMVNDDWKTALQSAPTTVAIMLGGGGSPTKDFTLAQSLLEHSSASQARVTMTLVDTNVLMLIQSLNFHRRTQAEIEGHERLDFIYVKADILKLGTIESPLFARNGPALFALTGGTIGNLSERAFFQSLNQVAHTGDLLVLSGDTVDDMNVETIKHTLAKKYDSPEMQRWLRPGIVAVLNERPNIQESIEKAVKRARPDVRPNSEVPLSDIPETWNVTFNMDVGDGSITLMRSTRYTS